MKISLVLLLEIFVGVMSLAYGYQRISFDEQLSLSHPDNNYRYYIPYYGFNHAPDPLRNEMPRSNWENTVSKTRWREELSKSRSRNQMMKMKWNDPMSKSQWKDPMSKSQFKDPMSKPQWKDPMSKPQWKVPVSKLPSKNSWDTRHVKFVPCESCGLFVQKRVLPANFDSIEWPEYIPPVSMIKPALDEPPTE